MQSEPDNDSPPIPSDDAHAEGQPVGLAAAAARIDSDEGAQGEGESSSDGAGAEEPQQISIRPVVQVLVGIVSERFERADEGAGFTPVESSSLTDAWTVYLDGILPRFGPLAQVLLVTGIVVGPRIAKIAKKKKASKHAGRTIDIDATTQPAG